MYESSRGDIPQFPPIEVSIGQSLPRLEGFYGPLSMPPSAPFQYFIWHVLEAHAAPASTSAAFMMFRRLHALTPDAVYRLAPAKLDAAVGLAGPYKDQRTQAIRRGVELFRRSPGRFDWANTPVRAAIRSFRALPRLGDHDARRMLLFVAGYPVLPIDGKILRVATRLGYSATGRRRRRAFGEVRKAMSEQFEPTLEARRLAVMYLTHHAILTCTETNPHCQICPLQPHCPEGQRCAGPAS